MIIKNHFHKKGFALGFILKQRLVASRKWPINCFISQLVLIKIYFFTVLAKDCGTLKAPSNGSLFGDRTTYPHDVSFSCDDGFILKGSKLRSCTSEGVWSGTPSSCEGTPAVTV